MSSNTHTQFLHKYDSVLVGLGDPLPTCVWGNFLTSLERRVSRQQEKKRPERAENGVFKGIIYKLSVSL